MLVVCRDSYIIISHCGGKGMGGDIKACSVKWEIQLCEKDGAEFLLMFDIKIHLYSVLFLINGALCNLC